MRFGIGPTIAKAATTMRTFGIQFLKDNLKLFFDFKNTDLEHVGTGSANFSTNQSLTIPTAVLDDAAAFTIMAWAKKASLGDADGLVICGNASAGFYYRSVNATSITASVALDGANAVLTSSSFTDSLDWMHFALTYDGSIVTTYVNGEAKGTHTGGSGVVTSGSTIDRIGEYGTAYHNGKLKNFAVWHRALNASEVQNVMFKTYTELQGSELTHLKSWYALESSTLSGSDATGNNDIAANNNTVTFTDSIYGGNTPTKPRGVDNSKAALADQIGSGSASFDGIDDYISISHNSNLAFASAGHDDDSAFSVVAWIKPVEGTKFRVISKSSDTNSEWLFGTNSSDKVTIVAYDNTTANNIGRPSTENITENAWSHIAGTYDGSESENGFNVYINGVLDNGTAFENGTYVAMHNLQTDIRIGANDDINDYAEGNIAQVGVFNAVLTQEQIQSIKEKQYSELTTSEKTNLVSWWGLDSIYESEWNPHSSGSGMLVDDLAGTETLGSNLVSDATWTNASSESQPFETFTTSGNQIIQASNTTGHGTCSTSTFSLEVDAFYKLSFNLGYTADDADNDPISVVAVGVGTTLGSAPRPFQITSHTTTGSQTYYFKVPSSRSDYRFGFQAGNNKVLTITLSDLSIQKVTGKNFGTLE